MNLIIAFAAICAIVAGALQIFTDDMGWGSALGTSKKHGEKIRDSVDQRRSSIARGVLNIVGGLLLLWLAANVAE